MPFQNMSPERQRTIRLAYKSKQLLLTADYYARKKALGVPLTAPVTLAGQDRKLWRDFERLTSDKGREGRCNWVITHMFGGKRPFKRRRKPMPGRDKRYRDRLREQAIAALGNACVECNFTGNPLAFDIACDPMLERGASGRSKHEGLGPRQHRRIVNGDHTGVLLLCGCCSNVRTRSNGTIHANLSKPTHPDKPTPPAPGLLGAGAAGPGSGSGEL